MPSASADRPVLRELARKVADVAVLPVHAETIRLWKALNSLKPLRPMVMLDQLPWHEMDVDGEMNLQTHGEFARRLETRLRRTLYKWNHIRADMVVEPFVEFPKVIRGVDLSVDIVEARAVTDPVNDVVGHSYVDQLKDDADLEKLTMPEVSLDEEATARVESQAHEALDGILGVRMEGFFPTFAVWDRIVERRGAEISLFDLAARPDFTHRLVRRLTDIYASTLDQLEAKGLLGCCQSTIHCTGAYADELPAPGFDPAKPRASDIWTFGMAQIFAQVSPAMHREFELDYLNPLFKRFGLVYYGCCEPLDRKLDLLRTIPNLRKISMSPWVDLDRGAEAIGRDFVFSRKPSPALLAGDSFNADAVSADLRAAISACSRRACPLELILKDVSTVRYRPQRLWEWSDLAMRLVSQHAGM